MKIHFLGTGAADWDIKNPRRDKDFRRFSSILVDGCLLVDPGPCIFEFAGTYGYADLFSNVKAVINTHRHSDHFCEESLERLGLPLTDVAAFETVDTGSHLVTAYPANHGTVGNPRHFVIESKADGKRFFYGCDGAWLLYPTYSEIRNQHFDAMIFECTVGEKAGDYRVFEHNDIAMVRGLCAVFANNCPRFYVSHMAKTLHSDHASLAAALAPTAIPAYDDMFVEL